MVLTAAWKMCLVACLLLPFVAGCRGELPEPAPLEKEPLDVSVNELLEKPAVYDHQLVRVSGICRIEFEGNALYVDRDAFEKRAADRGIWLNVGWPVNDDVPKLSGETVTVVARFSAYNFGTSWRGALMDVRSVQR